MSTFFDYYTGSEEEPAGQLEELRLGPEPRLVLLFTDDTEDVDLHYVSDEEVRSYVVCPGEGCPVCYTGTAAKRAALLPVFDLEDQTVKVLRVPYSRRLGSLGLALIPHLRDSDIHDKLLLISRDGATYNITTRALPEHANRGETAIGRFVERRDAGLRLSAAFPQMPAEALAEVGKIRNKLDAIGGWTPPQKKGDAEQ